MRKSKPVEVVVHMPDDKTEFEKAYVDATFEAINHVIETTRNCPPFVHQNQKTLNNSK